MYFLSNRPCSICCQIHDMMLRVCINNSAMQLGYFKYLPERSALGSGRRAQRCPQQQQQGRAQRCPQQQPGRARRCPQQQQRGRAQRCPQQPPQRGAGPSGPGGAAGRPRGQRGGRSAALPPADGAQPPPPGRAGGRRRRGRGGAGPGRAIYTPPCDRGRPSDSSVFPLAPLKIYVLLFLGRQRKKCGIAGLDTSPILQPVPVSSMQGIFWYLCSLLIRHRANAS